MANFAWALSPGHGFVSFRLPRASCWRQGMSVKPGPTKNSSDSGSLSCHRLTGVSSLLGAGHDAALPYMLSCDCHDSYIMVLADKDTDSGTFEMDCPISAVMYTVCKTYPSAAPDNA
eukprot:scpid109054/ scgid20347/ 